VADKQQIKEKDDVVFMMMIMEIGLLLKKRMEEQLRYISYRTARSFFFFFSISSPFSLGIG
jgi:hypothetical protein